MGAIFAVPVIRAEADPTSLPGTTVALVAGHGSVLGSEPFDEGVTLMIGAEREGLPDELIAAADTTAQIPIASHSLNAAMAATVALYEVSRMARG